MHGRKRMPALAAVYAAASAPGATADARRVRHYALLRGLIGRDGLSGITPISGLAGLGCGPR
jgi:hypothetical protein